VAAGGVEALFGARTADPSPRRSEENHTLHISRPSFLGREEGVIQAPVDRIAIVGMAGRFPGAANLDAFWEDVQAGRCRVTEVPPERWDVSAYYDPDPGQPGKSPCKWGGFLDGIADFDPLFFQLSGAEAEFTDPQQRLFMEEAWSALEHAGYSDCWLNQRQAGVFVGVGAGDYTHKMMAAGLEASPYAFMGNGAAVLAGRIAYLLNLRGPALAVDTACSSSLMAVHLACQSLRAGECELALAGGVFIATMPGFHALTGRLGMLSPTGQCRAFDQGANGFVPGEGVGVVVLRPLEAALRDGDTVHGVLIASGSNQDGRSNGIAAPSALAQRELLETVYEHNGIDPATISFVEAHGTGTPLGDPIEFEALNGAFRRFTDRRGFCALGSVKANIGHAGPAAGIAGLLKTLLMLKHRQWPPLPHFTAPNPHIALADSPFLVNRALQDWPTLDGQPRRAAVSSFGLSGTNAHIVVEEPPLPTGTPAETGERQLLALSAHAPASLQARLAQLQDWLAGEGASASLADIAYTLNAGRTHFTGPRTAVLATDHADAIAKLQTVREQGYAPDCWQATGADSMPDAAARAHWQREWRELKAQPRSDAALARIAAAYVAQYDLDWEDWYPDPRRRLPLPTYPFSRARYWLPEPATPAPIPQRRERVQREEGGEREAVHAFRPIWQLAPTVHQPLPSPILVLGGAESTVIALGQRVNAEGGVLHSMAGDLPGDLPFDSLFQQLRNEGRFPAAIVILPNSARSVELAQESELSRFRQNLDENLQPLLALAGSLVREGMETPLRVISVHDDDAECGEAFGAAAGGFDRSLRSLAANLRWTALRLSWHAADPVEALLSELRAVSVAEEVWWQQGQRYEHQWVPVTAPAAAAVAPWRRGGVYWITGGCGALGLLLARHLVETQGAHVVVSGRTAPSGAAQAALAALGDHAWFLLADVANPLHLHHAYQQIGQRYGQLHGVLHTAGTLTSEPVHRKTAADFEAVLAPKVLGALLLDAVTRDEPLDCFLLFSSLAAAVGDFGQCDYAVANRFLDGFAAWRTQQTAQDQRHGRTLAIDWPLWEQGGLQRASSTANGHAVLARQAALPTGAGLQALEQWLASEESCIALAVDEATAALLQAGDGKQEIVNRGQERADSSLLQDVAQQVAAVVKLPPAQLDPQAGLASFGLDSLNMKRLAEQLSAHYQLPLNPTVLFERNSIAALADYLATRVSQKSEPPRRFAPPLLGQGGEQSVAALATGEEQSGATFTRINKCDAIAIIGIAGRFPQSPDLEAFWKHLAAGDDLISEVPPQRWDWRTLADSEHSMARWGGFMADIDRFDAALFGISPREAAFMDPQHRLFLETVWAALENAGYRPGALAGRDVGVFVGCQLQEYFSLIGDAGEAQAQAVLGNTSTMLANRVSFLLDWHGPSQTLDTACSSALVAVHRAMRSLRDGDCELAIAGGAHLLLAPETYMLASQLRMLSPDGRCKTFDQSANGYVKGEGVGAVLLKPLDKAEADGDFIHAVIRASAENHGGRAHFLTAPNPEAQARLLVAAYTQADMAPDTVSYIEAHGTGTELGDPIEIEALNRAFHERAAQCGQALPTAYCGLGSVKSNIGHLEPAAGIAGLLKMVLALRYRQLPATLHVQQVNPYLNLDGSPFRLVTQTEDWLPLNDSGGQPLPRRAGVSSFGFGGSNAHVVLEEYVESAQSARNETRSLPPAIFPLSARSEEALRVLAEQLVVSLRADTGVLSERWPDLLFTLQTGREAWPERLAFVADSPEEGLDTLERWLSGEPDAASAFRGRVSVQVAELTLFDNSDELHAFARAELAKGRRDKIARLWAAGATLDWTQLGSSGRRLPLPGVPFADTRYWFNHPRRTPAVSALTPRPSHDEQGTSGALTPSTSPTKREGSSSGFSAQQLRARLRVLLADALYLPEDSIDDEASFVEMGLDSILAVELVNRLNKELGSEFKATRLYDHASINALTEYLAEHLQAAESDSLPSPPQEEGGDVVYPSLTAPAARLPQDSLPVGEGEGRECIEAGIDEAHIRATLRTLLADALYLEPEQIDEDANFTELGLDSILAVELVKKLTALFPVELKATRLYDHPTIRDLAAWLADCGLLESGAASEAVVTLEPGVASEEAAAVTLAENPPVTSLPPAPTSQEQEEQDRAAAAVLGQLRLLLARLLYLDPAALDDDLELLELGLDTVSAGQLSQLIAGTLGVELPAPRLLGYPGLAVLAADIAGKKQREEDREPIPATDPLVRRQESESKEPAPAADPVTGVIDIADRPLPVPASPSPVAIIGMAGRFPGAADLDAFWNNLAQGVDAIREVPPERWDLAGCYDSTGQRPNSTYCRHGGFLEDIDRFDPLFFNIAPQEAEVMDPQQRLFLEEAWKALEDAGYSDRALANSRCAIYVGAGQGDYFMHSLGNDGLPVAQFGMGSVNSILAARLAYWLNLKGAAIALDTACSSSLAAVHLACRALQDGDCDLALAGGVSLMTTPQMHILTSQSQMLSPDGRCKTFAHNADGFVPGEGVGVIVLKPLERALADCDSIHGVIIGSGLNQDGRTNGITAPSVQAQSALQQSVYQRYGINPETIGFVEAHGTGTKLGDPIEIEALTESFRAYTAHRQFCAIGSVKTNIGHALPAAGIAGLLKVVLALRHRQLPPSLHCHRENEHIDFVHSPFRVNRELRDWLPALPDAPRRAAINSFGFSGTNAHLVIEEAPLTPSAISATPWNPPALPFTLSAKSKAALRQKAADLSGWLAQAGETVSLPDVSYTLNVGRSSFRQRLAWVAATPAELRDRLAALSVDDTPPVDPGEAAVRVALTELQSSSERQRAAVETLAAAYWAGRNVDWWEFYPDGVCRRLSLPVYPFQGKRYWVKTTPAATTHSSNPPLPEGREVWDAVQSGLLDGQASMRLSAADPLLKDHRVQGQALLPAAGYLSLTASAAAVLIPQRPLTGLRALALAAPLTVAEDASCALRLRLTVENGAVRLNIASIEGIDERQHASGFLDFAPVPESPTLDLSALRAACPEVITAEAVGQRFTALGIEYGPTYRLLQTVRVGADQALGELATPSADSRFEALPPGLLDAALQTLIGFVPAEQAGSDRLMLPFAIEAVWLDRPLADVCYVHARRRPAVGDTLGFDLSLSDSAGRVCLRFENIQARAVKNPSLPTLAHLTMHWAPTAWPELVSPPAGAVLILRSEQDFGLSAALRSAFPSDQVHEVWLADHWQRDSDHWQINAHATGDFTRLFREINDLEKIYFVGGLQGNASLDPITLEAAQEQGLLPLFHVGQALAAQPLTVANPLLVVVTNDSEAVDAEIVRLPHGAACRGLAKVIGRENPGLAVTCLDLSLADLSPEELEVRTSLGFRLAAESGVAPFATVAWRGDQRY